MSPDDKYELAKWETLAMWGELEGRLNDSKVCS